MTGNLSPTRPVYGFISTSTPAKVGDGLEAAALALGVAASMTRYLALHAATSEGVVDGAPLATREPLGAAWRERCAPAGGRLVLLVRLWTDELRRAVMSAAADDAGLTRLAFVQARACVMMDLWPCPVEDAALVAAVQLSGLMLADAAAANVDATSLCRCRR